MSYDPFGRTARLHSQQRAKRAAAAAIAASYRLVPRSAAPLVPPAKVRRDPSPQVWRAVDCYAAELLRRHAEHSPHGPRWRFVPTKEASGAAVLLGVGTRLRDGDALVLLVDGTGTLREADTMRPLTLDQVEQRMRG
ncbi:hypothetical protein [Roseomonas rosulenta]|uniref:hypothetical protein n=1 Tax=Roseomonas rosulenta TaxID=2748667 RepID=UPI0018E06517|nr:hypothetical protein [Roseomonas rosulenta]